MDKFEGNHFRTQAKEKDPQSEVFSLNSSMFQTKKSNASNNNSKPRDVKRAETNLLDSHKNSNKSPNFDKSLKSSKSNRKPRQRLFTLGQAYQVEDMGLVKNFGAENQLQNRFKLHSQLSGSDNQSTNTNVFKSKKREVIQEEEEEDQEINQTKKNIMGESTAQTPQARIRQRPTRPARPTRPKRSKKQKSIEMKPSQNMAPKSKTIAQMDTEYGGNQKPQITEEAETPKKNNQSKEMQPRKKRESQNQIIKNNIQNSINNESMLSEQMSNFINLESLQQFNLGGLDGINLEKLNQKTNGSFDRNNFQRSKTSALSSLNQIPNMKNSKISFEKGLDRVMKRGNQISSIEENALGSKRSSVNSISFEGMNKKSNNYFIKQQSLKARKKAQKSDSFKLNPANLKGKKISFGFFQKPGSNPDQDNLANDPDLILRKNSRQVNPEDEFNLISNEKNGFPDLFHNSPERTNVGKGTGHPTRKKNPFLNSIENVAELKKLKMQGRSMKPEGRKSSIFSQSDMKHGSHMKMNGQKAKMMRNNSMLPPESQKSPMDMKFGSLKPKSMRKISDTPLANSWAIGIQKRKFSNNAIAKRQMAMPFPENQNDSIDLMDEGSDMEDLDLELRDTIGERPVLLIPDLKKIITTSQMGAASKINQNLARGFTSERKGDKSGMGTDRTFGSEHKPADGLYSGQTTSRNNSNFGSNNGSFANNTIQIETFGPDKKKELRDSEGGGSKRGSTIRAKQFTFNNHQFVNSLSK